MPERILLDKPDLGGVDLGTVIQNYLENKATYDPFLDRINNQEYLYWTKAKQKPRPEGVSSEQFWALAKLLRKTGYQKTPVMAENGNFFSWYRMRITDERLHEIDMYLGGQLLAFQSTVDDDSRQRFMARGILEESIASSQLEGASTSRKIAKEMIAERREPSNESERMIFNNYQTLRSLESEYADRDLSLDMLYEIHASLTSGTVDSSEQYRLRLNSDEVVVSYQEKIAHIPPREDFLAREIERLISFANDENEERFIHPVIKAVFLHFWVGYLHPFTDGNGRLARTIFYWYLLKKDYWVLTYLPISSVIKKAPGQYAYAYINSEQDDNDLTYFFDFHSSKILQAISDLKGYVAKIDSENRIMDKLLGREFVLNDRQKRLIHHVISDKGTEYGSIIGHMTLNNISRPTANEDIKSLVEGGLLEAARVGRRLRYYPTDKLLGLVKA